MNNLGIVITREYMTRVKKKSFIILTILMPFLMAAVVFVPVLFSMVKDSERKEVVVADKTGKYLQLFIDAQLNDSTASSTYYFKPATESLEYYRTDEKSTAEAVISITEDLTVNPHACGIYSKGEIQQELQRYVEDILNKKVQSDKLASYDVPDLADIIDNVQSSFTIKTIKWADDGSESLSFGGIAVALGMIMAMLIYMFVMIYGSMVMQSVMEEKTNRIVEVIVGSVKPFHLMMGKIIGVMLVGFTQILVWGIMLCVIITIAGSVMAGSIDTDTMQQAAIASNGAAQMAVSSSDSTTGEIFTALAALPLAEIIILFIVYFLGGYLLYASFYAAIGASVNSQEDSSQFMTPMVIMMIIALYGAMGSIDNTDGPLAFWASMFPLTSPIVMMVRIPFGVPLWQEIISVTLLYATAITFVWLGGRIYRVGILMYGKKPSFKDMLKWINFG